MADCKAAYKTGADNEDSKIHGCSRTSIPVRSDKTTGFRFSSTWCRVPHELFMLHVLQHPRCLNGSCQLGQGKQEAEAWLTCDVIQALF